MSSPWDENCIKYTPPRGRRSIAPKIVAVFVLLASAVFLGKISAPVPVADTCTHCHNETTADSGGRIILDGQGEWQIQRKGEQP